MIIQTMPYPTAVAVPAVTLRGTYAGRSSSATSLAFVYPAGFALGDRCVISVSGDWEPTVPVGWTALVTGSGVNINGTLVTKILTEGDIATGSVTFPFNGSGTCQVLGGVFVGSPNVRGSAGQRVIGGATTSISATAVADDYALWFAALNSGGTASPSCSKGSILETTANTPWLELTGATLTAGDISGGNVSANWTTTGDAWIAAVTVIPADYATQSRVTNAAETRVTSTGQTRIITERTA